MTAASQAPGRVLILGDSFIHGLGTKGQSFARMAATDLGATEVLDLSAVSKTASDTLADADEIRAFAPDLVLVFHGGTESLVLPGAAFQEALVRFGPKSLHGVAGLEPRAVFSSDPRKRRKQQLGAFVKHWVKRVSIRLTGGGRRVSIAETAAGLNGLAELLSELDCAVLFVNMPYTDERKFPKTPQSLSQTRELLAEVLDRWLPDAALVPIAEVVRCWEDYLADNMHLTVEGHRRVADVIVPVARELLAATPASGLERAA